MKKWIRSSKIKKLKRMKQNKTNMEEIIVKDAYENNLKHVNVEIPLNVLTCVTGCSGSGKSSLVFNTIYAESQRCFWESMTENNNGQKLMDKPRVKSIDNLRPALNLSQNYYNVNPRSSVGTITDISYYFRSLFALLNSTVNHNIQENMFSPNNPKSCCKHCAGMGEETVVSESLLIPEKNKRLCDGAILFFNGSPDGKEQKTLEAMCEYYKININKKITELSKNELDILLYSDKKIKYKITYKDGKRRKAHYIFLQGAVSAIQERLSSTSLHANPAIFSNYLKKVTCSVCNGAKLRKEILQYRLNGLNFHEIDNMDILNLFSWLKQFDFAKIPQSKQDLVSQTISIILRKINFLIDLNVGYLCLSRTIPSLSEGECQRIRLATQLTCPLKELLYILDEPCKGLHFLDVSNIICACKKIISRGNTIIAIEHNKQFIANADKIITLGPKGGEDGGHIIPSKIDVQYNLEFKKKNMFEKYCECRNISFHNIKGQDIRFPIGGITCVTGVSGSGKSSMVSVISKCLRLHTALDCDSIKEMDCIKKVIEVNQRPIGKTPRSTIVSYLEIFDEIRSLFAQTSKGKSLHLNAASFSMNVKGGRCEVCQGTGLQKIDLNFLPSSYITCQECEGKRFNPRILSVKYNGQSIYDILESPISEIVSVFSESSQITSMLQCMLDLGLGYLKLGQMSMHLSGGEAQRIKLAKALGISSQGKNLYILDEPTTGLNSDDIKKLTDILCSLQQKGETMLIIEHNLEFVAKNADYVIDFGVKGGDDGGKVVAQGLTEAVFKNEHSSLYKFFSSLSK